MILKEPDLETLSSKIGDLLEPFQIDIIPLLNSKNGEYSWVSFVCIPRKIEELKNMDIVQSSYEIGISLELAKSLNSKGANYLTFCFCEELGTIMEKPELEELTKDLQILSSSSIFEEILNTKSVKVWLDKLKIKQFKFYSTK